MAVIICVQDRMHAEFTIEFTRRGFHVLCEKPLGVDVQECITVAEEVEKAAIAFALGHSTQETCLDFESHYQIVPIPHMYLLSRYRDDLESNYKEPNPKSVLKNKFPCNCI